MGEMTKMSDTYKHAIPIAELYKRWGFDDEVFYAEEARKEKRLEKVILQPPWFFDILGTVSQTDLLVIVGARGAGKSALRRYVNEYCETKLAANVIKGDVLTITIDHDVPYWIKMVNEGFDTVKVFSSELGSLISCGVMSSVEPDTLKEKLSDKQVAMLVRYIKRIQERRPEEFNSLLKATQSRFSRLYTDIKDMDLVKDVIDVATSEEASERIRSRENNIIFKYADEDLATLITICKKCGFDAVYVLIDELDEYDETRNAPHKAAELISPILMSLRLLETNGLAIKFFLSEPIYGELIKLCNEKGKEIRWDRIKNRNPYHLAWGDDEILEMLRKRLQAYSIGKTTKDTLAHCCKESIADTIDQEIAKFAYRSPRHYIQFADEIATCTARQANAVDSLITPEILDEAKKSFANQIARDLYEVSYVNTLKKIGSTKFTENELCERLKLKMDNAIKLLDHFVARYGIELSEEIEKRCYKITDPRLIFLVEEK